MQVVTNPSYDIPSPAVYGGTILPLENKSHSTLRHMIHIQVYNLLGAISFPVFFFFTIPLSCIVPVLGLENFRWRRVLQRETFRYISPYCTEHPSFNTVKALCIVSQIPEESYGTGPPQLNEKKEGKKKNIAPSAPSGWLHSFVGFPWESYHAPPPRG